MASAHGAIALAVEKLGLLLAQQLGQLLIEEVNFLLAVRDDVEWLRSQLRWMESFLKDADARGRKGDERTKNWVSEVRDVAYQAEDVVDNFMWQIERRRGSVKEFFRRYAFIPSELVDLHDIGNQISLIKSKVRSIRENKDTYGIINLGESRAESSGGSVDGRLQVWRQLSPRLRDDTVVVGFDVHEKLILERLLDPNVKRSCVISIVGMGGLGKTTLATRVYNSNEVKSHFSTCTWITVSQDYRARGLLSDIAKRVVGLTMEELEKLEEDVLRSKLHNFLQERKYLIVLDDIWEQEVWLQIRDAFPNASNGSRLLITTRFVDVAKYADPRIPPYEPPILSDEESWELFLKVVFPSDAGVTPSCPMEVEKLGRDLVKKCGGLPLAVVVLGGLLSITNLTVNAWREVADNMDWESTKGGKECLQILALSYNNLPNHNLKSCFLYLGSFPEDYRIQASELIRLWIAEGFIPLKENRMLEETAKGYLEELVQRCMVQFVNRSVTTGRVKSFRIHDLFRDWCILEAKEERFFRIHSNCSDSADHDIVDSRRLILYDELLGDKVCYSAYRARTLLGLNLFTSADKFILNNILQGFKLLRVLHLSINHRKTIPVETLSTSHGRKIPKEISSLIHLRDITLKSQWLHHLPSSVGKLRNLQTLDVRETYIKKLPKTLFKIQTLRHIYTREAFIVCSSAIGCQRSLQTLKSAYAGSWIQRNLAKLSSLRKLGISGVSQSEVTALSDSLPKLNHLASLSLSTEKSIPAAMLFTSLPSHYHLNKLTLHGWTAIRQLHQNLINLSLEYCKLDQDAIDAVQRLPSLKFLNLVNCTHYEEEYQIMICFAGGFPQLQNLQVTRFDSLKYWRIENGAMSNLTYLMISCCRGLSMVPDGLEYVSSLEKLSIERPQKDLLGRISDGGEDRHKIQNILDGKIYLCQGS